MRLWRPIGSSAVELATNAEMEPAGPRAPAMCGNDCLAFVLLSLLASVNLIITNYLFLLEPNVNSYKTR